ncbi:hypothetical protein BBJ28_00010762 [Nothophytophthora sp. Chile5]|nr:hypothetical protein BBJ28_00010762 [Nothophytophthora sp. Chile5]
MSLMLVDDDQVFEAALSLLDQCEGGGGTADDAPGVTDQLLSWEASTISKTDDVADVNQFLQFFVASHNDTGSIASSHGNQGNHGQSDGNHDTETARSSTKRPAVRVVHSASKKAKKTRAYNPNRAREAQYQELLALREQVPLLEQRLEVLQRGDHAKRTDGVTFGAEMVSCWQKLAALQQQTRVNAEEENARLRELVQEQAESTSRSVQTLLQARLEHPRAPGFVTDDTVVESFGEEHQANNMTLDFTIKQIVRRYEAADRIVIAWRALIAPKTFKDMDVTSIRFEEKGALVLEPRDPLQAADNEATTIVRTWQMVTPELPDREGSEQNRSKVHELTEFVINACRPGRAVQSMERTLRQQAMQSMLAVQ